MEIVTLAASGFDFGKYQKYIDEYAIPWGKNIIFALLTYFVGKWIAKIVGRVTERVMERGKVDATLRKFLGGILRALLMVVVILAALGQLGVETTSALAILGGAALAVGLALQGTLSNFAAGVMLILFKPFKVGDLVSAGGSFGVVHQIDIFNTVLTTVDNRKVYVPNGSIAGGTIENCTVLGVRRVDMTFGIGYGDDIKKAKSLFLEIISKHPKVLSDPEPTVNVSELADSSVNFAVRPWCKTEDYWDVFFDVHEQIKIACDDNGISIPFPQQDVYMHQAA